ncbi:MAG: HAMP domain-containing sensor histidine kinase, partial [Polyangiales bacterium]
GSVLELQPPPRAGFRVGDIVAYGGQRAGRSCLIAHRVVAVDAGQLWVRGDAHEHPERVPASSVAYVVSAVARSGVRYETASVVGRVLAHLAVRRGRIWQLGAACAEGLVRLRRRVRSDVSAGESDKKPDSSALDTLTPLQLSAASPTDADAARDSMLRGLKDELRTPLNAILGFADLLLGELDGPLSSDERENVTVVREAGYQLLAMINEVLDLTTALMLPDEPVYEETDVTALLDEVRRELAQRCGARPVHVHVSGAFDVIEARLERRLLQRVLRALGEVALSATSAGGVSLGVQWVEPRRLRLWLVADGFGSLLPASEPVLAMTDPALFALGPARPRDRARRLSGMRFAIAQRLLQRHGAQLSVERHGPGDCLALTLPTDVRPSGASSDDAEVSLALSYIAGMGHDLRTPLNAILGFADLLGLDRQRTWPPAQLRSLAIVRERAVDLCALIDDMIDWAKLEAGELELSPQVQPLLPLIERAAAAARQRSGTRGLAVCLTAPPDLGLVSADGPRCVQAVLGLLDHAIRANPGPSVDIRLQRTAAGVRLELTDPGLEIRSEDHVAVFDAFRPSHAPTGQRIAGLQLGPSVARSLLRAHGGDVWFESRPGQGTRFTASLPVAPSRSESDGSHGI